MVKSKKTESNNEMERIKIKEERLSELLRKCDAVPRDINIVWLDFTGSTNTDAKLFARDAVFDAVFVADRQTAGRGRLGRSFSSDGGGLYMSLLFKRTLLPDEAMKITVYAAVCAARVIKRLTELDVKVKWVNDLFLGKKKLAGILCEGACDEFGKITHAVLGIGINIFKPEDPEISDIATSLSEHTDYLPSKEELAAAFICEMYTQAERDFISVINEYRSLSLLDGRRVTVIKPAEQYSARVLGIDDLGALVIENEDGKKEYLATGEVSVRF